MRVAAVLLVALLLGPTRSAAQTRRPAPVNDYHAHLRSEAAAKLLLVPPVADVTLPAEIDGVIREWEHAIKADPSSLPSLFTVDGLMGGATGWIRGTDAIRAAAADYDLEDLRVRAHAYSVADTLATVSGSLANLTPAPGRDVASVTFTLRRGPSGRWLIGSLLRDNRASAATSAFTADRLVHLLDSAGIGRAVVLSEAYWFGSPLMPGIDRSLSLADEEVRVRAENDWVAEQVAKYPNRLVAFCSVNPLKTYAIAEIQRCAADSRFGGLKLHLANSEVDLRNAGDVAQLGRVFRAANTGRLPIVVHMRPRRQPYGREDVEIMLRDVLPQAPDVPIQIAHFAGWGGYDDATDQAIGAFADAVGRRDPATRHLYFDIAQIVFPANTVDQRQQIVFHIRQLGLQRVVFGSDVSDPRGNASWYLGFVRQLLPLTKNELATITSNVTPYLVARRQ